MLTHNWRASLEKFCRLKGFTDSVISCSVIGHIFAGVCEVKRRLCVKLLTIAMQYRPVCLIRFGNDSALLWLNDCFVYFSNHLARTTVFGCVCVFCFPNDMKIFQNFCKDTQTFYSSPVN